MTSPVSPVLPATQEHDVPRQRWGAMLFALAAFVLVPLFPSALRSAVPIVETVVLVVSALAVCSILGWLRGGSPLVALLWTAIAAWMLTGFGGNAKPAYYELVRGWTVLLVAAFGIVSLVMPRYGFLVRAMFAGGVAIGGASVIGLIVPDGIGRIRATMAAEYGRRTEAVASALNQPVGVDAMDRNPAFVEWKRENTVRLRALPQYTVPVIPAMLVLESLAALALAWALFRRLSAVPIGAALRPVREFRFNDQLIWGVIVGVILCILPLPKAAMVAGINLLIVLGMLYLIRGIGVLSWGARGGRMMTFGLILLTAFAPLLAGALALAVGVADTWVDWRKRFSPAT